MLGRGSGTLRSWSITNRRFSDHSQPTTGMFEITISWRVGRVDAAQNLSGHQAGPEGPRPALADLRLEIQREERLKDIEGQEGQQQEALNRIGAVHIDVVGMPAINQFVEPVVFDVPALVAEADARPVGTACCGSVVTHIQSLVSVSTLPSICRRTVRVSRERMTRTGTFTWGQESRPGKSHHKHLRERKLPCAGGKAAHRATAS